MSKLHAVLLDLDGTLIDSRPGIAGSARAALRSLGHAPDDTLDVTVFIGPPLQDMLRALLQAHGDDPVGDDQVDAAVLAYRQHYGDIGLFDCALYPGIRESLQEMHGAGLQLYLATSKREVFARRILEHLGLASLFAAIHGSVPSGALDHKPELLAHILSMRNISARDGVMIGDRRHDIAGAHAVGLRSLGVLWGYGSRDELEAAGADRLVESPLDLARMIASMVTR
ncbi:HAD hydrolase-like protein [Bradyrhizobium sp. 83002]|uniref:HAD hydrolase-like protein n=1 Tax=Bradyrhizobium aeschynomenes TaxID=2734909 RepID=UPI0015524667|nr:HAD hydrolase-like protein [Bradyrhizobium aeschynomenes]NPU11895.1 HAD hydrolase-like protein [Bradyrhizobium aeschynomenes]NPV22193.1 HAD hydrolase-like protein [Bradyrhizobium aeschynomenes]